MAHFAKVDDSGLVTEVLVVDGSLPNRGLDFLLEHFPATWIETDYEAATSGFRKNFAGVGMTYDKELDAFIPIKFYESWILNEDTCRWEPPIPMPKDGRYRWNEELVNWEAVEPEA